ncbi:PH domain-containing protein [Angustibacter sp. McL0619]|uniref:PH domain-containing protein n=1 Tax=Angustibacter sp. McL0619 TaxID=3415676 RepID=UPI003CF0A07E
MGIVQPVGPRRTRTPQPALNPIGLRRVHRYLLPSERAVIVTRRHWAVVAEPALVAVLGIILSGVVIGWIGDAAPFLVNVVALGALALCLRAVWRIGEYWWDWFVVTDARLLLTQGLLTRRVAVMPLTKVTDMSYNVSMVGRVLGYGEFVFESAGQEQALHKVTYLGRSNVLFAVLSEQLFGEGGIVPRTRRRWDD